MRHSARMRHKLVWAAGLALFASACGCALSYYWFEGPGLGIAFVGLVVALVLAHILERPGR